MTPPVELPPVTELHAPPRWQVVDFISDLHLGEDTPGGFAAWAHYLQTTPADAVFILGDLFEVWVGDDARFEGFEARCTEVLAAAAATRDVLFMAGNRDFLVGPAFLADAGAQSLQDPTVLLISDARILLSHGDLLCLDDGAYQQFRTTVRGLAWQRNFLALALSNRRRQARAMREGSRQHNASRLDTSFDVDAAAALQWMQAAAAPIFIHGHTHKPATHSMAPGSIRHVLSDWDFDHAHPARADVLRWQNRTLARLAIAP